jgi:DNA-binding MarR family transcriptional regulator
MTLESEIKQSSFTSPYHRLVVNLLYTSNWLTYNQLQVLKPFKLTLHQYNVLRILRGASPNPTKVSDITERMLDKMSNASRLVDKLLAKELVQRSECPSDRRAVDVLITEAGLTLLSRIDEKVGEWELSLHGLNVTDAIQLGNLLDQLRASRPCPANLADELATNCDGSDCEDESESA